MLGSLALSYNSSAIIDQKSKVRFPIQLLECKSHHRILPDFNSILTSYYFH